MDRQLNPPRHKAQTIRLAPKLYSITLSLGILCSLLLLSPVCHALPQASSWDDNSLQPNVYLSLGGGFNLLSTTKLNNKQSNIDDLFSYGYAMDTAIGFAFNRFISSDISLNYLNNAHKNNLTTPLDSQTSFALYQAQLMLNSYFHLPFPGAMHIFDPFIGGGVGYNWITFTKHMGFLTSSKKNIITQVEEFAIQASGGLNMQISRRAQLGAIYRFSMTDNNHLCHLFADTQKIKALYNQSIILQLTLHSPRLGDDDL